MSCALALFMVILTLGAPPEVVWENPLVKVYFEQSGVGVLVGVFVLVAVAVDVGVVVGVSVGPCVKVAVSGGGTGVSARPTPGSAIEREVRNVSTTPWR